MIMSLDEMINEVALWISMNTKYVRTKLNP